MNVKYCSFLDDGVTVREAVSLPVDVALADVFAAEFVPTFSPCPDDVVAHWRYVDGAWLPPEEIGEPEPGPEPAPVYPIVSPVEFKLLFLPQERIAIEVAKADDPVLQDFYTIIDDPRLTCVDLSWMTVQNGIDYLIGMGLVASDRREQILTGAFQ